MATIRLIPSTYALSNSSYLSVSNVNNMYANTDSTTYGTVTHNRASTNNTYYLYLRGFNIDDVPSNATVSDFTVKIKASATGHTTSTSSSYYMSLINGTTQIGSTSASGRLSTTTTTFTFAEGSLTWDTIVDYGSNFGIRIPLRRANSNTADVVSVYGAEIEVTYTVPNPRTITSSLNGNGTISPSGTTNTYEGAEYTLTITPTNNSDEVTATKNGTDITSLLVPGYNSGTSALTNLGTYTLVSGSFNSGESYFQGLVGKGVDNTQTTSNYYSGGSGVIAVFTYNLTFSNIPSNAIITRLYVLVNGHAESTSNSSEYMCALIITGSTALSDELNFKDVGTSNSTLTIEATTLPTIAQLSNLKLQCRLGYYGGAINGATAYIEYTLPGTNPDYYTYTYTVGSTNDTIVVNIGSSISVTGVSLDLHSKTILEEETFLLTATVSPSDAGNKNVTWSTSSSSIATVSNGLVTAVSPGTATITVTTVDGGFTDTCTVTVTAAPRTEYEIATTMEPGKSYIVASGNSGNIYMMSNVSGGSRILTGVPITVTNGKISLTAAQEAKCLFSCIEYTSGNNITTTLESNGSYLYCDNSSGLRFLSTNSLNRFWHYNNNKFWLFKSSSSDGYDDASTEYKYYLQITNGNFTDNHVTDPSIEESNIPAIYLFTLPSSDELFIKKNNSWAQVNKIYKKINGTWTEVQLNTLTDRKLYFYKG